MAVHNNDNQNHNQIPDLDLDINLDPVQNNSDPIFGWDGLQTGLFGAPINDTQGAAVLVNAVEAFNAQLPNVMEKASNQYKAKFLRLDTETHNQLPVAIIVAVVHGNGAASEGVAYQPILVDATNEVGNAPVVQDIGGQPVEILRLTANSYTPRQTQVVETAIRTEVQGAGELFSADPITLPRDFDLTDEKRLMRFVSNSLRNCISILNSQQESWNDLSLRKVAGDKTLATRIKFAPVDEQMQDATGLPLRSDVRISLTTIVNQNQQFNRGQDIFRPIHLASAAGYMDLVFTGRPDLGYGMMAPQHIAPPYVGQFILTHLSMDRLPTVGGQILSLASALGIYQGSVGLASLFPNRQIKDEGIDYNDIGALNIEANITNAAQGQPIEDLKSASTTDAEIWGYMQRVINPTFELGLDVSDAGADTTQNSIFVAAAQNDQGAKREIIASADILTDGIFSHYFDANLPIARVQGRIPLGNYSAANGNRRDIRDASYLAVMNQFGQTDLQTVHAFSNAQWNPGIGENIRLSVQRQIINNMLSDVVYTDTATRIIFDYRFLGALSRAVEDAGVSMQVQAPVTRQAQQMYTPDINLNYSSHDIMGGLFNQQYGAQHGGSHFQRYSPRWNR